jgi:hypothetical protein
MGRDRGRFRLPSARAALSRQLAASRRAAGLSRGRLAPLSGYSRGTIANAETGRQRVPREFWRSCEDALGTGTALVRGFDEVEAAVRSGHVQAAAAAQRARVVVGVPVAVVYIFRKTANNAPYYSAVCRCGWFAEPVEVRYPDLQAEEQMAAAARAHTPNADVTVAFPLDQPS